MTKVMCNTTSKSSRHLCMAKVADFFSNITGKNPKDYPDYITVAIDWWANAVLAPQFDNGCDKISSFLFIMNAKDNKTFSEKEIECFKRSLAKQIIKEMKRSNYCYLRVDYYPNHALSVAGKKIGVNPKSGWPCKTTMEIYNNKVIVSAGYQAKYETLWAK